MSLMLRRFSIRLRLVVGFGVVTLVAMLLAGLAVMGFAAQQRSSQSVAEDLALVRDAQEAKYAAADWNGWQTAYAFDALRGVRNAAADDGDSRKAFLTATETLRRDLGVIEADKGLTADDKRSLAEARASVDAFMSADTRVVDGYKSRTPAGFSVANGLVIGAEIENYQHVATAVGDLAARVSKRASAAAASARNDARAGQVQMLVSGALGLVFVVIFVPLLVRSVVGPLAELRGRLDEIADGDGDLTVALAEHGHDELSGLARGFNRFVGKIADTVRSVGAASHGLAAAAEELSTVSHQISASSAEASSQAQIVAVASEEVSTNVQTVAAGSEEMGASIREIAHNANEAARVAAQAVTVAGSTTDTVSKLGDSSTEIATVVKVITSIAEQTNLLALNATIEAARAGEAGKGFAVVANEVKDLAQETARATEDISKRVETIQADTRSAVEAIAEISAIIGRINDFQLTIASAVEEQTATTNEMNRNVSEAATSSGEIASNISGVAQAASLTNEAVAEAQRAASELAQMSGELQTLVGRFRC